MKRTTETRPDGSVVHTTEFTLKGEPRPVRDEVVTALDNTLGALGSEVLHAMDPTRLLSFENGGPPIWSVGLVTVAGPVPYTLLVTYGFSHVLSPEPMREGIAHEYSLAVPVGVPLSPWADAFLRHQCRYILTQGSDIRVNDCVPFNGIPMTKIPFQPEHHGRMPDSRLVGIVATADPVLGTVETPAGPIEVRRLVGVDQEELDRIETWSVPAFLEELRWRDHLLLSPPMRPSHMADPEFRAEVDRRAAEEGSDMDAAMFDIAWQEDERGGIRILVPHGQAAKRLVDGIRGRLGFGKALLAFSRRSAPIELLPGPPSVRLTSRSLQLHGDIGQGPIAMVLQAAQVGVTAREPSWLDVGR